MAVAKEAVEYAKKCFADGFSDSEVSKALADAGWPDTEVSAAIGAAKGTPVVESSAISDSASDSDFKSKVLSLIAPVGQAMLLAAVLLWVWGVSSCQSCLKLIGIVDVIFFFVKLLLLIAISGGIIFAIKKYVLKK